MKPQEKIMLWSDVKKTPDGAAGEFQPYLEPYLLPGDKVRGCVIVCPGGGYSGRASHEGVPVAEKFNSMGFHAFVLQYRVMPYVYPAPQKDALRAIKIIRAHAAEWGIKPDKIAILGFSAGGHLACSTGVLYDKVAADNGDECDTVSARPDAEILCYAVISAGTPFANVGSFQNLFGTQTPSEADLETVACEKHVCEQTPPAFLWHTAEDGAVPVENSLNYALALRRHKVPFAVHIFPDGPHGIGLADGRPGLEDVTAWSDLAGVWLKKMEY